MKTFLLTLAALAIPPALYIPRAQGIEYARTRLENKIRETEIRVEQARAAQRKITQFHEERQRLDGEMEKLLQILPATITTDDVHRRIESAAAISGVHILGFEPYRQGIDRDFRYQWIAIETDGSAASTAAFLTDLTLAEPILTSSNVQMKKSKAGWHSRVFVETFALRR